MWTDEVDQDNKIRQFLKSGDIGPAAVERFLQEHVVHPDHHVTFTAKVAHNVATIAAPYIAELSAGKRFHAMKAISKAIEVSEWLKTWEYFLSRDDAAWYWKGLPLFFAPLGGLTAPLESMRASLGRVDKHLAQESFLLVEGESEVAYLRAIQQTTRASNFDVEPYPYGGRGNLGGLVHLIKDKNRSGVRVYLSYDRDGKRAEVAAALRKRGCRVTKVFGFKRDFESSFPPDILAHALAEYGRLLKVTVPPLTAVAVRHMLREPKPFTRLLAERYGLNVNKPDLGWILGQLMGRTIDRPWTDVFNRTRPRTPFHYEAYRFLKFVMS